MKIILRRRRGGKTTKAVELCKKTGAYLLVINEGRRRQAHEQYGLPLRQIKTHHQLLGESLRGMSGELVIDDADYLIKALAVGFNVRGLTISKPFTKADCNKFGLSLDMVGRT